jgi:hypothetical protein
MKEIIVLIVNQIIIWRQIGAMVQILAYCAEVVGSIPTRYKHLCAWTYLLLLGLGVFYL